MKKLPLSIIIPTFNEEKYLPRLLLSIQKQSQQPAEVIVADAYSLDRTRKIAKKFGCKVVAGGLPGKARNNGAKAASQKLLLFLDADVVLPASFLEETVEEMVERDLAIASCYVKPISRDKRDILLHKVVNYYLRVTRKFHPHIPGFCIFIYKELHELIGGFDESLVMAEDHDYVRRAKKRGRFSYLTCYKIPVSVRRLVGEGRLKIAAKYIAIELHLLFIGQIRKNIFRYEYSRHLS